MGSIRFTGMGGGAKERDGEGATAAALRAAALDRLRQAAASHDPERFEGLVWSALDLLDRARAVSGHRNGGPHPIASKEE